jgi:hypothetical protein
VLVDEDVASLDLLRRLEAVLPGQLLAPERATSDAEVWSRAQRERAAVLTGNVVDFLRLAGNSVEHHGLLLVYRLNDPMRDMRASEIAARVAAISGRYPAGIAGIVLAVNNFPLG